MTLESEVDFRVQSVNVIVFPVDDAVHKQIAVKQVESDQLRLPDMQPSVKTNLLNGHRFEFGKDFVRKKRFRNCIGRTGKEIEIRKVIEAQLRIGVFEGLINHPVGKTDFHISGIKKQDPIKQVIVAGNPGVQLVVFGLTIT